MKVMTNQGTLIQAVLPRKGILYDVLIVLGFSVFTALCAQLSFWIGPVPITGQTFAVLLTGLLLGSRRGAISQLTYVAIGATGVPFWFALGGPPGVARLVGPTGGFLLGFVVAAFVVGMFADRGWDRSVWKTAVAMLAGSVAIYAFGLYRLAMFVGGPKAIEVGLLPFLVGDTLKIVLAMVSLPAGWRLLQRSRSEV